MVEVQFFGSPTLTYSTLIFKMALNSAGYRASQLTRPDHGFANSPFGIRFLNPLWTSVEDRFIDERVTIQGDNAGTALAILRDRLAANRVVIITVHSMAHRIVEVPFFQHSIRLPTGPMRLMRETGAALLPAFVFAVDNGRFDVTIESALPSWDKHGAFDTYSYSLCKTPRAIRQYISGAMDRMGVHVTNNLVTQVSLDYEKVERLAG